MKYTVEIGWHTFEFEDSTTAINFAVLALTHHTDCHEVTVRISKKGEEDE